MGDRSRMAWGMVVLPVAGGALATAVGYWPTRSLSGPSGVTAMLLAQALVLGAVWATLWPALGRMAAAEAAARLAPAFKAAGQRFVLTVLVAGVVGWHGGANARVFLVWVAISYVMATMAETIGLVWWLRSLKRPACG